MGYSCISMVHIEFLNTSLTGKHWISIGRVDSYDLYFQNLATANTFQNNSLLPQFVISMPNLTMDNGPMKNEKVSGNLYRGRGLVT